MRNLIGIAIVLGLCVAPAYADKPEAKRQKIDNMAKLTLENLFEQEPIAKKYHDKAYGYAVLDNVKVALVISGGGGQGVAVEKSTEDRTYLRMGTAGINVGLGAQKYQIVFFFESEKRFKKFLNKGWIADINANAVAGTNGVNAEATFHDGVAFYQITDVGLMLQADVAGTKYWKNKKLNKK